MSPPSNNTGIPMYKNRLQEFAQKSGIQLPVYRTINEGFHHAPKYRTTVLIDGLSYTSPSVFPAIKASEQGAAKVALDNIIKNKRDDGHSLITQYPTMCKSILNEYAVKMSMEFPKYTTNQSNEKCPVFSSSLVFGGKSCTGEVAKSKKEAEQLAARKAIQLLLGSGSRNLLNEIITSKAKLCAMLPKVKDVGPSQSIVLTGVQPENSSQCPSVASPSAVNFNCGEKRKLENNNSAGKKLCQRQPQASR